LFAWIGVLGIAEGVELDVVDGVAGESTTNLSSTVLAGGLGARYGIFRSLCLC
jgi:hypothetical protein